MVEAGDANHNNSSAVDVAKNVEEAYECDYERDCTPLYSALENALEEKQFEPIIKFLDTGYWTGAFFSDPISPADQAKTWVTRFDPEDPNKVKWSQLPLHLAIVCNAPPSVIGRLVRLYPQALRCTDDQHMLPLHLALRHGSNDEVIAFLLMKFPDAVNAKGKNGRTAVDCALRAKDKLRGKILELFVEKTRGRKSHGILKEQRALRAELAAKDAKLEELNTDLEGMSKAFEEMKTLKTGTEQDLLLKIQQLEQTRAEIEAVYEDKLERMESEKVVESVMMQKKLEALQASHDEIQTSERLMRMEESELRTELEKMHTTVSRSVSPEDLNQLKREVEELRAFRLERSRSTTKTNIDTLKSDLEKTMEETKKADEEIKEELKAELRALKKTVEKLASPKVAKTGGELNSLRNEVDTLRAELKERAESNKTKAELMSLKEAMAMELKNSEGKTKEELAALRKAIEITSDSEVKNKTSSELVSLKQELESLKKEMKNKELINRTKRDLDEFKDTLATAIEEAPDSKTKVALSLMQKSADKLDDDLQQCSSGSEVIAVKQSIDEMKRDVKKRSTTFKILCEAAILKNSVDASLNNAEGKTFDDLASMKKAVKALNEKELATKSVDDLNEIKISLVDIKSDLKDLEAATQAQLDLHAIKKTLQVESKSIPAKSDKETSMMKIAIDAVNMDAAEAKDLKKSLASEIKENNTKIGNDLAAAKVTLDGLDVKTLDRKDKAGWDRVRSEIAAAKKLVEDKMSSKDSVKAELELIKKTAEDKKKGESEYESLREVRLCFELLLGRGCLLVRASCVSGHHLNSLSHIPLSLIIPFDTTGNAADEGAYGKEHSG